MQPPGGLKVNHQQNWWFIKGLGEKLWFPISGGSTGFPWCLRTCFSSHQLVFSRIFSEHVTIFRGRKVSTRLQSTHTFRGTYGTQKFCDFFLVEFFPTAEERIPTVPWAFRGFGWSFSLWSHWWQAFLGRRWEWAGRHPGAHHFHSYSKFKCWEYDEFDGIFGQTDRMLAFSDCS